MDTPDFILIVVLVANLFLELLLLERAKKSSSVGVFTIAVWTLIAWTLSIFFYRNVGAEYALLSGRILYISALFIPLTFLYFVLLFPSNIFTLSKKAVVLIAIPTMILAALIAFTDSVVREVTIRPDQENILYFGSLYPLYILYISGYFLFALWHLFKKRQKAEGIEKLQIGYILLGTFISITLGSLFNLFLPSIGDFRFNWLGNVATLVMVSLITYAIVKERLFDIRVVLTQLFTGIVAILLFINLVLSESPFEYFWKGSLFVAFLIAGYLLVRSVMNEIRQREELEKLSKAKSEFMSIASHQLRTPLSVIKGYISLLEENSFGGITSKQKEVLGKVFKTNEGMITMVNDLLNVTRAEEGRLQYSFEKTDLAELIKIAAKALELTAKQKGLTLEYQLPIEPIIINVDKDKMTQAISNLVDNAIKYTEKGGIKITATIDKTSNMARVSVADTGLGIGEEEIKHLFESFSRGKAGTKSWTKGAGLGLYIAKQFVEAHKGKIWATSEGEGKGSTFFVELPV